MRYFILDDDVTYCIQLEDMLLEAPADNVHSEQTIGAALDYMRAAARDGTLPDVILCDYNLGGQTTGLHFLEAIQIEGFDVPAVLLTDFDEPAVIKRAEEHFAAVHVAKTGLETAELIQQISVFALRRWAEQRRLAAQQLRRQASNMMLLGAGIAHEFNDMIRATILQLGRLKREAAIAPLTLEVLERFADQIEAKFKDGIRLSDMLMRYGGELEGHEYNATRVDLVTEIRTVAEQPDFSALKIAVASMLEVPAAMADGFVVRRVLSILFSNINEHADGAVDVKLTIGETTREGGRVIFIDVEDSGPGVPADLRKTIFEVGERGGKQIQYTGVGGLGLGLGFAKALVAEHIAGGSRGSIHCLDRIAGTGARFRISLPQE
ncbi:hypothetical protein BH10PSE14_BH10PSE14_37680 [soil metagenome]